jgi:hypothetical protein
MTLFLFSTNESANKEEKRKKTLRTIIIKILEPIVHGKAKKKKKNASFKKFVHLHLCFSLCLNNYNAKRYLYKMDKYNIHCELPAFQLDLIINKTKKAKRGAALKLFELSIILFFLKNILSAFLCFISMPL